MIDNTELAIFDQINYLISKGNITEAVQEIIGLSLYGDNRLNIHDFILKLLKSCNNKDIQHACIKAAGHLVRIDGFISNDLVSNCKNMSNDIFFSGVVEDLIDDINIFYVNKKI